MPCSRRDRPINVEHSDRGCLTALSCDGENLAGVWGFETSDARSFFSLEHGGYGNVVETLEFTHDETSARGKLRVAMQEGKWQLDLHEQILGNALCRSMVFEALTDTWVIDIVARFTFPESIVERAWIAGEEYAFEGDNVYHQHPVREVVLQTRRHQLTVELTSVAAPESLHPVMYVRSSPRDGWVVHARLLPREIEREVLKFRGIPLPNLIANPILSSPRAASWFRYIFERKPHLSWLRTQGMPLVLLRAGTRTTLETRLTVEPLA